VFAVYNEYELFKNKFRAKGNYGALTAKDAAADQCVACGVCVEKCPQNINIPEEMPKVHEKLTSITL
jgi:predicted aldo/keto reductase-like oxidoreductase